MTENLKCCPFCGGEAKCIEFYGMYHVICCDCHIAGHDASTREKAIEAWNTRRIEDAKDEEIKRIREALNEIKKTVEDAQDTVYPFHIALDSKDAVHILEVMKEALKGEEE